MLAHLFIECLDSTVLCEKINFPKQEQREKSLIFTVRGNWVPLMKLGGSCSLPQL